MKNTKMWSTICTLALFLLSVGAAVNENKVKPGEFIVENPTLINLGFEWLIQGDDNRNAQVAVSYRKQGDTQWKSALPLLHLQGERIYQQGSWDVELPNMFAGSILDRKSVV